MWPVAHGEGDGGGDGQGYEGGDSPDHFARFGGRWCVGFGHGRETRVRARASYLECTGVSTDVAGAACNAEMCNPYRIERVHTTLSGGGARLAAPRSLCPRL